MTTPKHQLIQETRTLIQFAITVAIFFSGLIAAVTPGKTGAILWGIAVAVHACNYLAIEWVGGDIRVKWFKWLKASLYLGIAAFIPLILFISGFADKQFPVKYALVVTCFLGATLVLPIITFIMIVGHLDWIGVRDIHRFIVKKWKRNTPSKMDRVESL